MFTQALRCGLIWLLLFSSGAVTHLNADGPATASDNPAISLTYYRSAANLVAKVVPRDTLIRIDYVDGWSVVVFSVRGNGIVPWPTYVDTHERVILFAGGVGDYLAIGTNPDKPSEPFQLLVRVRDGPTPDPVDPDDPDPPTPTPVPDNIPNQYGIGAASYRAAIAINNTSQAQQLARGYEKAVFALGDRSATLTTALTIVRNERNNLGSAWNSWEQTVEPLLKTAVSKDRSIPAIQQYLIEIQKSLELAGTAVNKSPPFTLRKAS